MEIPHYPNTRDLDLSDKLLLDDIFYNLQPQVSELTFANLYLFREAHEYRLTRVGESVVVFGRGYDGQEFFMPPLNGDVATTMDYLFEGQKTLYGADEKFAEKYLPGEDFQVTPVRASDDYLYLREELATLPGNRFHKKKNRINYFTSRHTYQVELMTVQHAAECRTLLSAWHHSVKQIRNSSADMDFVACDEALLRMAELGLQGVVVRVYGNVKAFALGERLNSNTVVCHFEKADPFMEGLAQLVNREFALRLFNDCQYMNREQDLGDQGLRTAKLSYHPCGFVRKFRACRKNKFQQNY